MTAAILRELEFAAWPRVSIADRVGRKTSIGRKKKNGPDDKLAKETRSFNPTRRPLLGLW